MVDHGVPLAAHLVVGGAFAVADAGEFVADLVGSAAAEPTMHSITANSAEIIAKTAPTTP